MADRNSKVPPAISPEFASRLLQIAPEQKVRAVVLLRGGGDVPVEPGDAPARSGEPQSRRCKKRLSLRFATWTPF
jgi:hypothetical protein